MSQLEKNALETITPTCLSRPTLRSAQKAGVVLGRGGKVGNSSTALVGTACVKYRLVADKLTGLTH